MSNPFFGRKWKILVMKASGEEAWSVSDSEYEATSLRCQFTIEQSGFQTPWYSDVAIWNLAGDTKQDMISACREDGASVVVEAGYRDGKYGKIFDGDIFQPLFDRLNATDNILTLHCIDGLNVLTGNLCSFSLEKGYDYAGIISEMSKQGNSSKEIPIDKDGISPNLDKKQAPRGASFYGEPRTYLRNIARDNNAQFFMRYGNLNMSMPDDESDEEPVLITPDTSLIGTPQQITNGVSFTVLLNPELEVKRPLRVVKLDNTVIRQQKLRQGMMVSPLDQDGLYKVIKVTHRGDTRGNDWYTDVIGINKVGNVSALLMVD